MKLADIEEKAQNYFEWPDGAPRNSVTLTSTILFARACVNEAVAAEREACAQLMEIHSQWVYTADELAHAIRQRGAQ